MQQKTLYVAQGHLCSISDKGETVDKGNCGCALVALPMMEGTPKYSLVCYNKKRETLAVARLPQDANNATSLRLAVERSGYLTFRDEADHRWSLLLSRSEAVVELLAHVALAFYTLRGQPKGSPVVTDFTPAVMDRPLGLQHEARVRYAIYAVRQPAADGSGLAEVGAARESNFGEDKAPYAFQPVQSSLTLGPAHRGFEGAVAGMTEGGYRGIVLPSARLYAAAEADFSPAVFVVRLERIVELAESRAEIPAVFADAGGTGRINGNSAALVSYQEKDHRRLVLAAGANSSDGYRNSNEEMSSVAALPADGLGIPTEHMSMIQKVGAGVNAATTLARDVRDITAAVADDWEHAVRAVDKPSTLTNAALLDHLRQLVQRQEDTTADLEQREELIRSLDARNRELQKQVDTAAITSQKLLDEAKSTATAGMDIRLERSRTLMKLQEQINTVSQERDDAQRHLATVKRLQAASEEELQQIRARIDVHRVQAGGMASELEVSQTALAEARGRRKGLEARLASLTESVRSAHAQTRAKASELASARTAADRARDYHVQLMEDERNNRAVDAQQLRSDIVSELAHKEQSFRAERARAAEDGFRRGLLDGKEQGRRDASADAAAQLNELQLNRERSKGLVETRREELRSAIEHAMASRRKLVTALKQSQAAHDEALRTKLRLQVRRDRLTREAATAKDMVLDRLRGVSRYITQPASNEQLLSVLSALHHHTTTGAESERRRYAGEQQDGGLGAAGPSTTDINLAFDRENWDAARKAAIQRRLGYIAAEALRVFEKGMDFYYAEWLQPLQAAHDACRDAVKALWIEQHGTFHYTLCAQERSERCGIEEESDSFFAALEATRSRWRAARTALLTEAQDGFEALHAEYSHGLARLRDMLAAHRKAREVLAAAEAEERLSIISAAMRKLKEMPSLLMDAVVGERLTAQRFLAEEEEAHRAALLADELGEATVLRFNEERDRDEARLETLRARQRHDMHDDEGAARQRLEAEEAARMQQLYTQHISVVSAIFRQTQDLQRLLQQEQQRQEALRAEERRALVVAEEQHRYAEVEGDEERERAELVGREVAQRPSPPPQQQQQQQLPLPQQPVEEQQPTGQQQQAPPESAQSPATQPPPVPPPATHASESGGSPERSMPPPLSSDDDTRPRQPPPPTGWDGPPDVPPPTPPTTPPSATKRKEEEPSPFALAWAQTDTRKRSPVPARTTATAQEAPEREKTAPPPPPPASKPKPGRGFEDSEADSSGSEAGDAGEGRGAAPPTAAAQKEEEPPHPSPPAKPAAKKALPVKRRTLFASSSDED